MSVRMPIAALVALVVSGFCHAQVAKVDIIADLGKAGPNVNPRLYGIFLEEINHGVDGGLYAELIRNRAFEEVEPPEGLAQKDGRWVDEKGWDSGFRWALDGLPYWSLVQPEGAKATMALDTAVPLTPHTPRSLKLTVAESGGKAVGVANEGFFGIGVKKGESYRLSFYARCESGFTGTLTASVQATDGKVCAGPVKLNGLTSAWRSFDATLKAGRTEANARFLIAIDQPGTIWLDFVSLFPVKTYKNRPNGFRTDIAQMIADLQPGFVRFPGGCVVEGGTIETSYNWKDTVGPLTERNETWGAWGYRRTHGTGYLEYLQFCEDLKAEPLYVGFAGQSCLFREAENVPMDEMGWVRQNFLDAIEYANGGTETKWGAIRAQHGRAKGFDMKMVEIGNENGTAEFPPRYDYLHEAISKAFPDINTIADLSWIDRRLMQDSKFDIEDMHYYSNPNWFMQSQDLYAERPSTLPPVYLGEVAVTSGDGGDLKGNLLAALGEGAFLMGCERNADKVTMVSYAPLLAHIDGRSGWHGMICHDSLRVFGTASYHLWKLFGTNRPDFLVSTTADYRPLDAPPLRGKIGVGTWETSAEYKDVRITRNGSTENLSDFSKWKQNGGEWQVDDGVFRQNRIATGHATFGDLSWSDYTLELKARKLRGAEGFLILFATNDDEPSWWNIGGWGNSQHAVEIERTQAGRRVRGRVETNQWYDIKVEVSGRHVKCYLNGELVIDETAPSRDRFFVTSGYDKGKAEWVLKAINVSDAPADATIRLDGAQSMARKGRLTVLTSGKYTDNNSFETPLKVAPKTRQIDVPGRSFNLRLEPRSLTVLRIGAGR